MMPVQMDHYMFNIQKHDAIYFLLNKNIDVTADLYITKA